MDDSGEEQVRGGGAAVAGVGAAAVWLDAVVVTAVGLAEALLATSTAGDELGLPSTAAMAGVAVIPEPTCLGRVIAGRITVGYPEAGSVREGSERNTHSQYKPMRRHTNCQ